MFQNNFENAKKISNSKGRRGCFVFSAVASDPAKFTLLLNEAVYNYLLMRAA